MEKVVRSVSVKTKRTSVQVIGYSASDRGSRYVNSVVSISSVGKDKAVLEQEIADAIHKMLAAQSPVV